MPRQDKFLPNTGRSSSPGTPGLSGAIKDAVGAIANVVAPRSIVQRKAKLEQDEARASGQPGNEDYRISGNETSP